MVSVEGLMGLLVTSSCVSSAGKGGMGVGIIRRIIYVSVSPFGSFKVLMSYFGGGESPSPGAHCPAGSQDLATLDRRYVV